MVRKAEKLWNEFEVMKNKGSHSEEVGANWP
jgi:hypothetical protein